MPGDDDVFVGFSDKQNSWYLRFYLNWNDSGQTLVGRFDLTLVPDLANEFEKAILPRVGCDLTKEKATDYFDRTEL
jgi:hypothetical protein